MSVSLSRVDGPGDAELIAAVRGGDVDAYGELFARHVDAARRLARQIAGPSATPTTWSPTPSPRCSRCSSAAVAPTWPSAPTC